MLVDAVRAGELPEARLDESVRRIMAQKFALGLFEHPYVDADAAATQRGHATRSARPDSTRSGARSCCWRTRAAILPLKATGDERRAARLPHRHRLGARAQRAGLDGRERSGAGRRRHRAARGAVRDAASGLRVRRDAARGRPRLPRGRQGYDEFVRVSALVPTVATVYLDRPAILTPVRERARALLAQLRRERRRIARRAQRARRSGKLPFDLPSSMESVAAQRSDVAHDPRAALPIRLRAALRRFKEVALFVILSDAKDPLFHRRKSRSSGRFATIRMTIFNSLVARRSDRCATPAAPASSR